MILQNLTKAIREQNYYAVVLEFLIVIAGVVIGFQITAWNEAQERSRNAVLFEARLLEDLHQANTGLSDVIQYYYDVRSAAQTVYALLQSGVSENPESFMINALRASQIVQGESQRSTFDELVSNGELELIKNEDLRLSAIYYYNIDAQLIAAQVTLRSGYRDLFSRYTSPDMERALARFCGDQEVDSLRSTALVLDYPCSLEMPSDIVLRAATDLASAPDFEPTVRHHIAQLDRAISLLETIQTTLEAGL